MPTTVHVLPTRHFAGKAKSRALAKFKRSGRSTTAVKDLARRFARQSAKGGKALSKSGAGHWKVVISKNGDRVISVYSSKREAIDDARRIAKGRSDTSVVVHGINGQVLQKDDIKSSLREADIRSAIRRVLANP